MAKLKFDRSINLSLKGNNTAVPQNEVWKVFLSGPNGASGDLKINGITVEMGTGSHTVGTNLLGGVLTSLELALLQGLRSRLLANIFAKEVCLA